jgi:hypothetical protein
MRRLWFKIEHAWLDFKWRCQRFRRGYADCDVWNMYDWFIDTVGPMLRDLACNNMAYPLECDNPEQWEEILMDMHWSLWHMGEENVAAELEEDAKKDYQLIYNIQHENKDHFFELFGKWFYDLWD